MTLASRDIPLDPVVRQCAALAGLPPYVFAALDQLKHEARAAGRTFTDLGIGSPDRPMPAAVVEALRDAAGDASCQGYPPFRGTTRYLDAIERFMQARFGVAIDPSREALALAGSKEGIAQLILATTEPGGVVLVPEIYYPVYGRVTLLAGARIAWMPMRAGDGFLADFEAVPAEDVRRASLMILNYPNNPTGAVADRAYYERAIAFARANGLVLASDLAYSELAYDGFVPPSVLELPGGRDVAVEFHSCSKSFNMAGLRCGFVAGNADAVQAIASYRTNIGYGVSTLVQHAGAYALSHARELAAPVAAGYDERRTAATAAFRAAGWQVTAPKGAMYLWLPVPAGAEEWAFIRAMLDDASVVVTPGSAFGPGGAGWFRLSLVAPAPMLADAVERIAATCAARGWTPRARA